MARPLAAPPPAARPSVFPRPVEALESRQLLSAAAPTDAAPHGLEPLDRARADPAAGAAGAIRGSVWEDANGDGKRGKAEPGLAGVTVFLDADGDGSAGPGEPTTTTAARGSYRFVGLAAGSYRVVAATAGGWRASAPAGGAVSVGVFSSAEPAKARPVGLTRSVAIAGAVFNDVDGDGVRGGAEPAYRRAKVLLDLNSDGFRQRGEPTAKVDKAGGWRFGGLTPGVYVVRLLLPVNPAVEQTTPALPRYADAGVTIDLTRPSVDAPATVFGLRRLLS